MLKIHMKMLPIQLTSLILIMLNTLFTSGLFLFVYSYYNSVWHTKFDVITETYLMFFAPINIILILLIKTTILNGINYSIITFFTKYLTSGKLPAIVLPIRSASKLFKKIFKTTWNLNRSYIKMKISLLKVSPSLTFFSLKHALIGYCTARNDENFSRSINYFFMYLKTYPGNILKMKLKFFGLRILYAIISLLLFVAIMANFPNYFNLPNYRSLHFVTALLLGYGFYKLCFSQYLLYNEVLSFLKFLQFKTLPKNIKGEVNI